MLNLTGQDEKLRGQKGHWEWVLGYGSEPIHTCCPLWSWAVSLSTMLALFMMFGVYIR